MIRLLFALARSMRAEGPRDRADYRLHAQILDLTREAQRVPSEERVACGCNVFLLICLQIVEDAALNGHMEEQRAHTSMSLGR
jgi:hypothetical protein